MLRNKTFNLKANNVGKWYIVDADGQNLGRLASKIAIKLMGKDSAQYSPHMLSGDYVIVINASKVAVTGNKMTEKNYYNHSGYPGGLKVKTLEQMLVSHPTDVIRLAVKRMLPKNKLAALQLSRLRIYKDNTYVEQAQKPEPIIMEKK